MKDEIGDRFKNNYENIFRSYLPFRLPIILRLDGAHFHTYAKKCARPFDEVLAGALNQTAIALCKEIQGAQFAYLQSDEISILIHPYKTLQTMPWVGNNIQKMTSISAAIASATMTLESIKVFGEYKPAYFDARVFVIPENEVVNYFHWRQSDWKRNSLSMLANSHYSHKQLHQKSQADMHELLYQKGVNWAELLPQLKNGRCVIKEATEKDGVIRHKWVVDNSIPKFTEDREYINKYLKVEE